MIVYKLVRWDPAYDDNRGGYLDAGDCELHLDRAPLDAQADEHNAKIVFSRLAKHDREKADWRRREAEHNALHEAGFRFRRFHSLPPIPPPDTARGDGRWAHEHYAVEEVEILP